MNDLIFFCIPYDKLIEIYIQKIDRPRQHGSTFKLFANLKKAKKKKMFEDVHKYFITKFKFKIHH